MKINQMKILKTTILLCSAFLLGLKVMGQGSFIPASPGVSGLTSSNSSRLSSGAVSESIPITSFSTRNLTVPVSLGYYSTGLKVEQMTGSVGMGWSLYAGGVISRMVRDDVDPIAPSGQYPSDLSQLDATDFTYIDNELENPDFDTEPDLFSFNFGGFSGSFVSDGNGGFVTMPYQKLDIEPLTTSNSLSGFVITSPDGIEYKFAGTSNEQETSKLWSGCEGQSQAEVDAIKEATDNVITAWYLQSIIHPLGDAILFEYSARTVEYPAGRVEKWTRPISNTSGCSNLDESCITYVEHKELVLEKIYSNQSSYGSIIFHNNELDDIRLVNKIETKNSYDQLLFSDSLEYEKVVTNRIFLKRVAKRNRKHIESEVYLLDYNEPEIGIPFHLSMSQDHWGYYNGKNNYDLIPKNDPYRDMVSRIGLFGTNGGDREPDPQFADDGLLKKITFPTGGSKTYIYEGNTVKEGKTIFGSPSVESFSWSFCPLTDQPPTTTFEVWVDEDVNLTVTDGSLSFDNLTIGGTQTFSSVNGNSHTVSLIAGMQYMVSLSHIGNPETNPCSTAEFSYHKYTSQYIVDVTKPTGGVRVKYISQFDPISGVTNLSRYYYGKKNNLALSSGYRNIKYSYDSYYTEFTVKEENETDPCVIDSECRYGSIQSNTLVTSHNTANDLLTYEYVTVSLGGDNFENGGMQYHFGLTNDLEAQVVLGEKMKDVPYSNTGWTNGLLLDQEVFKKEGNDFIILNKKSNIFHNDQRIQNDVPAHVIKKRYDTACGSTAIVCDSENTQIQYRYICQTKHIHNFNELGECVAAGANNLEIEYKHAQCYGQTIGTVVNVGQAVEHIDIMQYHNISHWYYLLQSINYQYDENGLNPVVTSTLYDYENDSYPFLTSVETTGSLGEVTSAHYRYPFDYSQTEGSIIDHMMDKNLLAIPIEVTKYLNDQVIASSATAFEYNPTYDMVVPKTSYLFENTGVAFIVSSDGENFPPPYRMESEVLAYDNQGQVVSQRSRDNVVTTYIRGNKRRDVVAVIQNATKEQIQAVLPALDDNMYFWTGLADNDAQSLREQLPEAMVTTYKFKEGYGITSITDPNGRRQTYVYDDFRRVKYVKDHDGNILSEHAQHIVNQ